MKKRKKHHKYETSPVRQLELELHDLRRELRITARNYARRLERELELTTKALGRYRPVEKLSREQIHDVRDFTILVRQRQLRPDKGRRKDLRKIDSLISDLRPLLEHAK